VLAVFVLLQSLFKTFEVFDVSMEPTYKAGDYILVNEIAYARQEPARGDVVALYSPDISARLSENTSLPTNALVFIKRIIGVGGDTVNIKDGKVFVNGCPIYEPYISEPCDYDCVSLTIPKGKYFVLGDDRNHSYDSHVGWLASQEDIIGMVCLRFWHTESPDSTKNKPGTPAWEIPGIKP